MVWTISTDSCNPISSREPRVFLCRFMRFMKHNRGAMDLQRWMTRLQLSKNTFIASWMDLFPDLKIAIPEAINCSCCSAPSCTWSRTTESGRHCCRYSRCRPTHQCSLDRWNVNGSLCASQRWQDNTKENDIPLGDNLSAIDFCKPGRFDARSEKHTHKFHDTSWWNIRAVQCAKTQSSIPGNVLHNQDSRWQFYDANFWHGAEKIFSRSQWGELDGTSGYWAEDMKMAHWMYQKRFQGIQSRRGKGKGSRKEMEKAEEDEDSSDREKEKAEEKEKERPL